MVTKSRISLVLALKLLIFVLTVNGAARFRPSRKSATTQVVNKNKLNLEVQLDPVNALLEYDDYDFFPDFDLPKRRVKKVLELPPAFFQYTEFVDDSPTAVEGAQFINLDESIKLSPALTIPDPLTIQDGFNAEVLNWLKTQLLSVLRTICPITVEKHSMMLQIVDESAQGQIQSGYAKDLNLPSINNVLVNVTDEFRKCGKRLTPDYKLKSSEIKEKANQFAAYEEYLRKELKRRALLSQKDVVPTQENVAAVFEILQGHVVAKCFLAGNSLLTKVEKLGVILLETLKSKKENVVGKRQTLHQGEMDELLRDMRSCLEPSKGIVGL